MGFIVEAVSAVDDGRVQHRGEEGEEVFEVGEEWWVVEGPWAGLVGVPLGEREGMGES